MEFNSYTSMLSDELKPRRTPVPASFGELMPRPSVPDLSIIEMPQSSHTTVRPSVNPSLAVSSAPLSHLSYNDWRQKTGGVSNGSTETAYHLRSSDSYRPSYKPCNVTPSVGSIIANEAHDILKERPEHMHGTVHPAAERIILYADPKHRPTSAPVVRPEQVESSSKEEHILSKSAPPVRATNQYHHHGSIQVSNRFNYQAPIMNHQPLSSVSPVQQLSLNRQSAPQSQGSNTMTTAHTGGHLSPNVVRRQAYVHSPRNNAIQSDHLGNHIQVTNSDLLSPPNHNHTPPFRDVGYSAYPSECHHHVRKNIPPCPCGEHICCPSATTAVIPHHVSSHIHSVPPLSAQNASSSQVSYDDLYKLVLAQNDQLKALQAQVQRLLSLENKGASDGPCKSTEVGRLPIAVTTPECKQVVTEEGTQTCDSDIMDDDGGKMSIGVMTSFIHAVTYRGRVGRLNTAQNYSEHESDVSNKNYSKQSRSPSSDDHSSSSSPVSKSASQKNCCKDCLSDGHNEKLQRDTSKNKKSKQNLRGNSDHSKRPTNNDAVCSEGCNCNYPGVSAAITAVKGCQAVLASKTHEFSTFNGADLPTVAEQSVSPMSSIHVDLHDYRSSSSDEESGNSHGDDEVSSDEDPNNTSLGQEDGQNRNGWTFYNNILGQVNKILEEREIESPTSNEQQVVAVPHKSTDISVSKRVAFEAPRSNEPPQNLKELALKYLKENHPEELASSVDRKSNPGSKKPHGEKLQERAVYNMPASNMSFATFRYLERYNLLPENFNPQQYLEATANMQKFHNQHQDPHSHPTLNGVNKKSSRVPSGKSKTRAHIPPLHPHHGHLQPQSKSNRYHENRGNPNPVHHTSPRMQAQSNTPTSKILDITTLRQQPKLL